jgi:hypothetical protein
MANVDDPNGSGGVIEEKAATAIATGVVRAEVGSWAAGEGGGGEPVFDNST